MKDFQICSMEYFSDRAGKVESCLKIADNLLKNKIYLYSDIYFEPMEENIFETVFCADAVLNREYLFAMDYLSAVLTVYSENGDEKLLQKFLSIVKQFFDYYERGMFIPVKEDDMIVHAHALMFIKSFTVVSYEESLKNKIIKYLYKCADYCNDDRNYYDDNNHGLFTDLALLHLAVLFGALEEAKGWKMHAVERVQKLFGVAFYNDGFNNEGSLLYFRHNIIEYREILKFCEAYHISGLEVLKDKLERVEQVFYSFAYSDGSYPIIGDGRELFLKKHNNTSALYPQAGICVVKTGNMYLTFKCKAVLQSHTHVDDTSITVRFRNYDLALDTGQYNYDRFHPVNRYLRTSGGHSGIFPIFADELGLREYLNRRGVSEIERFDFDGTTCYISGGYEMDSGAIKVRRNIIVEPERIEVRDSWTCIAPQNMRQRFVLPKEFLGVSRFTVRKRTFETSIGEYSIKYKITAEKTPIVTTMNFGVQSKQYNEIEPTILLDTVAENSMAGEITAVITVDKKQDTHIFNDTRRN